MAARPKKMACGAVSLRRHCPDQVPGGRRSASELSPASQPFLPAPDLPGTPLGPAPSITSQTVFTLHGVHDGRPGPKAPACTGQTSWLRRELRQRPGPVPGALYGGPGRQPRPAQPRTVRSAAEARRLGTAALMLPGSPGKIVHWRSPYPAAENRTILRHPPGQAPIVISGRRRLPEKGVEKPGCPTTPAPPFPVRSEGGADPAGHAGAGHDDLLAPEPANLTGALIGYARVSTSGQILDRQTRALTEAGCIRVFADKLSGKTADRPELAACLDYLRVGDTLVVPSLDRLSRSLQDLITLVAGLRRRGVGFRSLHEALDTTTPAAGWSSTSSRPWPSSHPRAHRGGHPRGPGRRPRPRPAPRPAPGDDRRADPPGPRPAHPARQQHLQHRPAARGQPL